MASKALALGLSINARSEESSWHELCFAPAGLDDKRNELGLDDEPNEAVAHAAPGKVSALTMRKGSGYGVKDSTRRPLAGGVPAALPFPSVRFCSGACVPAL